MLTSSRTAREGESCTYIWLVMCAGHKRPINYIRTFNVLRPASAVFGANRVCLSVRHWGGSRYRYIIYYIHHRCSASPAPQHEMQAAAAASTPRQWRVHTRGVCFQLPPFTWISLYMICIRKLENVHCLIYNLSPPRSFIANCRCRHAVYKLSDCPYMAQNGVNATWTHEAAQSIYA
jgi:hypothetical protein